MITWGLGIEHEFFLKFNKKKLIGNNQYDVYVNTNLIHNLMLMNEINFYQKNKNIIKNNNEYIDYINYMNDLIYIRNIAINKEPYPFEKKNYFNILNNQKYNETKFYLDEETINKMKIYYFYYTLYNEPLIFFNLKFNEKEIRCNDFDSFIMKKSNNKEELVTNNYKLLNELLEKKDFQDFKSKINLYLNNNFEIYKIFTTNTIYFTKKNNGNIRNNKDLLIFIKNQIKIIKKFIFNDIQYNKNNIEYIFYCYKNKLPEIDISSSNYIFEMKNINFKNNNFESTYNDFILYENIFIYYVNKILKFFNNKIDDVIYDKIGSRKESLELIDIFNNENNDLSYRILDNEDYTGSFHLWITCPYTEKTSKKQFLNIHANLANKLQLLEPLIACNFSSPSYQIKYDKNYPSKLSLRHFINSFGNYGTSDVSLINGSDYHLINSIFFQKEDNPKIQKIFYQKKKIYNNKNTLIKSYNVLNDRKYTNNIFDFLTEKKINSNNHYVKNFYELLFKNNKLSFKEFQKIFIKQEKYLLGADIRTRNNNDLMYPIDKNLKKIYYPSKNKYYEYYIDKEGKITNKKYYDKEEYNKFLKEERIGIEFRIFDHFDSSYLNQILCILPYIILDSLKPYKINSIKDTFISKQFWHNEMYNVITKGYKHNFSKNYIDNLNKEFKININNNNISSEKVLEFLYIELQNKYSKKYKYKDLLNNLCFKKNIDFVNINELATKYIEKNN